MLTFVIAIARGWTWLYTCWMEPALRDERRAEIESDPNPLPVYEAPPPPPPPPPRPPRG
jgi:hypothetical protein